MLTEYTQGVTVARRLGRALLDVLVCWQVLLFCVSVHIFAALRIDVIRHHINARIVRNVVIAICLVISMLIYRAENPAPLLIVAVMVPVATGPIKNATKMRKSATFIFHQK